MAGEIKNFQRHRSLGLRSALVAYNSTQAYISTGGRVEGAVVAATTSIIGITIIDGLVMRSDRKKRGK